MFKKAIFAGEFQADVDVGMDFLCETCVMKELATLSDKFFEDFQIES